MDQDSIATMKTREQGLIMFRQPLLARFVIPGLLAATIGMALSLSVSSHRATRPSLDDATSMIRVQSKDGAQAKAEPLPLNLSSEPGCECQGECGIAEQMRQSEP